MNYILKQFDNDLLYFSMENTNDGLQVHIISVDEKMKSQIPLDLDINDKSLKRWLEKRTVPRNRAYVSNFLARIAKPAKSRNTHMRLGKQGLYILAVPHFLHMVILLFIHKIPTIPYC